MGHSLLCLAAAVLLAVPTIATNDKTPFPGCSGNAMFKVTIYNGIKDSRFPNLGAPVPLVYSPPTFVSHSNRVSLLTARGFASPEITTVAKTGNNGPLVSLANQLRSRGHAKTVIGLSAPIMPRGKVSVMVRVNCLNPFISFVSMIAPTPDWIVFIDNFNTVNSRGRFINFASGKLIAYDAGVDSGGDFTPPGDASLDIPTDPPKNIAPLVEDSTDVFGGRQVGFYRIVRMRGD